jgi:hypothetical protein
MFVDPSKDWRIHMLQLLPIENPRGMAGLAKQKLAGSYREFDSDPTDPECQHANAVPTATSCTVLMECNTKHSVTYTQRKCRRCGTGIDNEQHLLFECRLHVALVANRSKHMDLFDGVSDVREWMAAAYKPELAASHSGKLHARRAARFEGWRP